MAERTCGADGCSRSYAAKGFCKTHYNLAFGHQSWGKGPRPKVKCVHCGRRTEVLTGACRKCTNPPPVREWRQCSRCGGDTQNIVFCSLACKAAVPACEVEDCERPHKALGLCAVHHNQLLAKTATAPCNVDGCSTLAVRSGAGLGMCKSHWQAMDRRRNPDRYKARDMQRRARKLAVPAEVVVPRIVFDRDNWVCQLCDESVDCGLTWPHPDSASVDHVVPLARGGHHTYANTQLAHLHCNIRKGARTPGLTA